MKANKFFAIALAALTLGFVACKPNEPEQKLIITPAEAEVSVAATVQLSANMEVTWSSSDAAIAAVNENGLVTGVAKGEATITAKAVKSNEVATCKITVKEGGVTPPPAEIPEIDVTDNSLEDWAALPAEYVVSYACPENAALLGLKGVAVYATEMYINILVEPNMDDIVDLSWVPFHVYIDLDNSDLTGGYGDEFTDANCDILCETGLWAEGEPCAYNPGVYRWWGEVGADGWDYWTDPSTTHDASDFWGAIIGEGQLPVGNSEYVDGKFEIQLLRELLATVPASGFTMNNEEFGIGFDIQQNWNSVGILPIGEDTEENPGGHVAKLKVKINK
ncbi:MAG: Ig-like domain-containing protein [Paludibacteraceae bacterium]|nr:Ig-like domain-containing protein [Paludibacteraceae bacterium]